MTFFYETKRKSIRLLCVVGLLTTAGVDGFVPKNGAQQQHVALIRRPLASSMPLHRSTLTATSRRPIVAMASSTSVETNHEEPSITRTTRTNRKNTTPPNTVQADTTTLGTLQVPSVGVGTISWSSDNVWKLENEQLQSLVSTACESNGAFFDTAERYGSHYKTALGMGWGETERLTQKLLKERRQSTSTGNTLAPVVATKFTPSPWRTTVKSVVEACQQSRLRLGVEQIDLYQLHMPDIVQPMRFFGKDDKKDEIYWDGLAECYHQGLVKNVGVSNYGPTLLLQCQEALAKRGVPLASNQIGYSLLGRHNGAQKTVDTCQDVGVKVLAFFPFAMGLLTGKYSSTVAQKIQFPESAVASLVSSRKSRFEARDLERYARGDGHRVPNGGISPLLLTMEQIAIHRGVTVAQVALNYIVVKGAIPIPGARTVEQLQDNMGAMGWRLTQPEVDLLEQAADSLGVTFEGAGFKRTSEKFVGYGVEKWQLD